MHILDLVFASVVIAGMAMNIFFAIDLLRKPFGDVRRISDIASADVKAWVKSNDWVRRHQYTLLEGIILSLNERAFAVSSFVGASVIFVSLSSYLGSHDVATLHVSHDESNSLGLITALWGVQAAIVGIVYPLVIAFIAFFFDRRKSEVGLYTFLNSSAALLSGGLSVGLLMTVGAQLLLPIIFGYPLDKRSSEIWLALDATWFIANCALTLRFVGVAFSFLFEKKRKRMLLKHAMAVALPRNNLQLTKSLVFIASPELGLLPKNRVEMIFGYDHKPVIRLSKEGTIDDVSLLRLKVGLFGVRMGLAKPEKISITKSIGWSVEKGAVIVKTSGGEFGRVRGFLIRGAFKLVKTVDGGVGLDDFVDDCIEGCLASHRAGSLEHYTEELEFLEDFFVELIKCSRFEDSKYFDKGSYLLISDGVTMWGTKITIYLQEVRKAIGASLDLDQGNGFFERAVYVPRNILSGIKDNDPEMFEHISQLYGMAYFDFSKVWRDLAMRSVPKEPSITNMVEVSGDSGSKYRKRLESFLSGVEATLDQAVYSIRDESDDWMEISRVSQCLIKHLDGVASIFLTAAWSGDALAVRMFFDILIKWAGRIQYRFNETNFYFYRVEKPSISVFGRGWKDVEESLFEVSTTERAPAKKGVAYDAIIDYWRDVYELCLLHIVQASYNSESNAELIASMIERRYQFSASEHSPVENLPDDAEGHFKLWVRHMLGSEKAGLVSGLASRFWRHKPDEMIPGRVYSSSGSDGRDSLALADLILWCLTCPEVGWQPWTDISQLEYWSNSERRQSLVRILDSYVRLLDSEEFLSSRALYEKVTFRINRLVDFNRAIVVVREGLALVRQSITEIDLDAIRSAHVSDRRLEDIRILVRDAILDSMNSQFPFALFPREAETDFSGVDIRSNIRVNNYDKGAITDPLMSPRAINEGDFLSRVAVEGLKSSVVGEILRRGKCVEVQATDEPSYLAGLRELTKRLSHPILLVDNPTRPSWLWDWFHPVLGSTGEDADSPVIKKDRGNLVHGYVGTVCVDGIDVPVYSAGLQAGFSYLLSSNNLAGFEWGGDLVSIGSEATESPRHVSLILGFHYRLSLRPEELFKFRYLA